MFVVAVAPPLSLVDGVAFAVLSDVLSVPLVSCFGLWLSVARTEFHWSRCSPGSFENEALENEDRSTKHPKLENEAPKTRKRRPLDRKRSTQISKTKHSNLENEAPKTRKRRPLDRKRSTQNSKTKHPRSKTKTPKSRIRWRQPMRPHLQRSTKSIPRFYKSLPTV